MTNKVMYLMAPGLVELRDVELPELKADEVLVKSEFSAISAGTELANFNDMPNTVRRYPRSFGYNAVGIVEQVGASVTKYKVGDRLFLFPGTYCMECDECISGHSENCSNHEVAHLAGTGGFAQYIAVSGEKGTPATYPSILRKFKLG